MPTETAPPTALRPPPRQSDILIRFWIGALSGLAALPVIFPIDTLKVRIQLQSERVGKGTRISSLQVLRSMLANGKGIGQFFHGISAGALRQLTYTTTRLGVYRTLYEHELAKNGHVNITKKAVFGMFGGFCGALVGNPAELVQIRFQSDATLPVDQQRKYRSVWEALRRIVNEDGVRALWKGCGPNIGRALAVNLGMLAGFDESKELLRKIYRDETGSHAPDSLNIKITAAAMSGVACAVMALPFDNAKTKMQKMTRLPDGTYPYRGLLHSIFKTARNEGIRKLWVGFPIFYVRIAPDAMISMVANDLITEKWKRHYRK